MSSTSQRQQRLFGIARAVQKGEKPASEVGGAAKRIARDVSPSKVKEFAGTPRAGLPRSKACLNMAEAGRLLINHLLNEDDESTDSPEERREIALGHEVLNSLSRLERLLPESHAENPQAQQEIATIRAAATQLIRMHQDVSRHEGGTLGDEG